MFLKFIRSVKECTRLDKIFDHDIGAELRLYKLTEKIKINKTN
jgi:hypothetical protein